jgi:hypothetical protein
MERCPEIPHSLRNPSVYGHGHRTLPLAPILNKINPIYILNPPFLDQY